MRFVKFGVPITAVQLKLQRLSLLLVFILAALSGTLGVADPARGSEAGEILLARGNYLYLHEKYQEAKKELLRASEVDPNNPEVWSLLGAVNLALKEYSQARDAFTKAVTLDPNIPRGKLYLGVSYYFLGNNKEAERWLKEAKALNPNDGLLHYYFGLLAVKENRPKEALTELNIGENLAPELKSSFQGFTTAAKFAEEERKFSVVFTTGVEYDDNVKVLPDRTTINPPGQLQYPGHKADWRTPLIVNASYQPINQDNWAAGVRYYSYIGLNYKQTPFNVFDQLGELYVKYQLNALTIQPYYAFQYTWLGGQPFSMINQGGLRLTFRETERLSGDLVYLCQYYEDKYNESAQSAPPYDRTGPRNQVGFFQTLAFNGGAARAGFIWEHQETQGINYAGNWYRFPVEAYYQMPWRISAYGYFEYGRFAAINRDSLAGKFRVDNFFNVIVQLRRPVTNWMSAVLAYNHISNPSNIPDYQYNRNIYSLWLQLYY
jgi:tetratricopeptide (TPR) repeat protein